MDSSSAGPERPPAPEDTGERLVPGAHPEHITEAEHMARYHLAAALAEGRRVLDVACGVGYGSAIMARAGAEKVVGLDLNERSIAWATAEYGDLASFESGDLLALPWTSPRFDMVVSFETIEHVTDVDRALEEMKRVMVDDGLLVISSPNRGRYLEGNPFHLEEMTTEELADKLGARYANVRILRQSMHLASVIAGDDAAAADGETPGEAGLQRLLPGRPGQEVYAIALASDGPLPDASAVVALADAQSLRDWHASAAVWEERARLAEAERQAAVLRLEHAFRERDQAMDELEAMRLRQGRRGR